MFIIAVNEQNNSEDPMFGTRAFGTPMKRRDVSFLGLVPIYWGTGGLIVGAAK